MTDIKRISIIVILILHCIASFAVNPASKLNVVILGDSNTYIGGDNCDNPQGWNKWFKDRFSPLTCISYARSGATWCNTKNTHYNITENICVLGDNNVIFNQINRLIHYFHIGKQVKPDLIIIAAGTNDLWFSSQRPEVFSKTAKQVFELENILNRPINTLLSLAESVRYNCKLLSYNFPKAKIVLLSPMQATKIKYKDLKKFKVLLEQCAKKLGINVIEQDKICVISADKERKHLLYTVDGVHTNIEGAKLNGYRLADAINNLLKSNL